jgi:hypothetical protein
MGDHANVSIHGAFHPDLSGEGDHVSRNMPCDDERSGESDQVAVHRSVHAYGSARSDEVGVNHFAGRYQHGFIAANVGRGSARASIITITDRITAIAVGRRIRRGTLGEKSIRFDFDKAEIRPQ